MIHQLKDELAAERERGERELRDLRLQQQNSLRALTISSREQMISAIKVAVSQQQQQHDRHIGELNERFEERLEKAEREWRRETRSRMEMLEREMERCSVDEEKMASLRRALSMARTQVLAVKKREEMLLRRCDRGQCERELMLMSLHDLRDGGRVCEGSVSATTTTKTVIKKAPDATTDGLIIFALAAFFAMLARSLMR